MSCAAVTRQQYVSCGAAIRVSELDEGLCAVNCEIAASAVLLQDPPDHCNHCVL